MRVLDVIVVVAAVTGIVALLLSFYNFRRKPVRSVLLFAIPLLVAFGVADTSQRLAQAELLDALDTFDREYQVLINGTSVPNPNEVLSALKDLRSLPAHHSHPTKRIEAEIRQGSRHMVFSLARDSGNHREYWVFYPKYYITSRNEVGRIVTPLFDQY